MQVIKLAKPLKKLGLSPVGLCLVSVIVTACATAPLNQSSPEAIRPVTCPKVTPFDRATLTQVADEEEHLPRGSALSIVVDDWIKMRDQSALCRGPLPH